MNIQRYVRLVEEYSLQIVDGGKYISCGEINNKRFTNILDSISNDINKNEILGMFDTTFSGNCKEGFLFTTKGIYYKEAFGKKNNIYYAKIKSIGLENTQKKKDCKKEVYIEEKGGKVHFISTTLINKTPFSNLINQIIKQIDEEYKEKLDLNRNLTENSFSSGIAAGTVFGNVSNASTTYGMDKFNTPRGHGFAAERANHIYDKLTGKDAVIVGDDNVKFGADRRVDGVNIQTKYCRSGADCVKECFKDGTFKYVNPDGSPMKIEVPSDKYESAIQSMQERIKRGEVKGISDPKQAENIITRGHFTYEQVKNISKFGTIESISFDAVNGVIVSGCAFGISSAITFATSIWNGDHYQIALKNATFAGLKVGGTTFITAILAGQLSRAGLNSALVGSSEVIVNLMGPKASALLVNALKQGKNIYGAAAMKSAAKMLRGNVITGAASIVIMSSFDVVNIFRGRISGAQLFKNITNTSSTVAGGTAGWIGGASIGAAIGTTFPGIGNVVGGAVGAIVGSLAGGGVAGTASNAVMGLIIEDDANDMVNIIEGVFKQLAEDYLLNHKEVEEVVEDLHKTIKGGTLKDMFASPNKEEFAEKLLRPIIEDVVILREKIVLPTNEEMIYGLREVLEDISDD